MDAMQPIAVPPVEVILFVYSQAYTNDYNDGTSNPA